MLIQLLLFFKQQLLPLIAKHLTWVLIVFLFCCYSCQNEQATSSKAIQIPNTPEAVCRTWQSFLDNNEIAKAMLLGSPKTKNWLVENQALFLEDQEIEVTQFLSMDCTAEGDAAICKYTLREEGEVIEDYFTLIHARGQWLIHIEEVDSTDPTEQLFEEMKKALEL